MDVYIVCELMEQSDFTDHYGKSANDDKEIIGVFDSYEKAERVKNEFQTEANRCVEDIGCNEIRYEIYEYTVY